MESVSRRKIESSEEPAERSSFLPAGTFEKIVAAGRVMAAEPDGPPLEVTLASNGRSGRFVQTDGPWQVSGTFTIIDGALVTLRKITVQPCPGITPPKYGITTAALRFEMGVLLARIRIRTLGRELHDDVREAYGRERIYPRQPMGPTRVGRPAKGEAFHHHIAELFLGLQAAGVGAEIPDQLAGATIYDQIGQINAREEGRTYPAADETVRGWVKKAQRLGFLTAGMSGRSPRRGKGPKFDSVKKGGTK